MTDGGLKQRDKTDEMSTRPEVEYEAWLGSFRRERLKILYYLGLTANPVFIAADILLHRPFLSQLFVVRCILELGLIISFVTLIRKDWTKHPRGLRILLVLWILIGNVCIAQMTVILGGFTSQYYNGLNLVFFGSSRDCPNIMAKSFDRSNPNPSLLLCAEFSSRIVIRRVECCY